MDKDSQDGGKRLPVRASSAIVGGGDGELAEAGGGSQAELAEIVRQVRDSNQQAYVTLLRRALFLWLRIYAYEWKAGEKTGAVNIRIPIPLPLIGAFFRQRLSWSQAFRFIEQSRRSQGIPPSHILDSCMAVELLRINEAKRDKEGLLVIGFD